ncbi:MAG: hypothetical protein ACP5G4_03290 [bacterium]
MRNGKPLIYVDLQDVRVENEFEQWENAVVVNLHDRIFIANRIEKPPDIFLRPP